MNKQNTDNLENRLESYYNSSTEYLDDLSLHNDVYFASYLDLLTAYITGPASLLEIGCGSGCSTYHIAKRFPDLDCLGNDLSAPAIKYAVEHFKANKLRYAVGNAVALDFPDNHFSVITSFDCLEHIPNLENVLRESMRLVNKKGLIIIKGPNHLSPLHTIIDIMMMRYTYKQANSWFGNFGRLLFEIRHMLKGLSGKVDFVSREPDLTDTVQIGNDADAVNDMSNLDVANFFKQEGWEVLNISWPRKNSTAGKFISRVMPLFGSMGIVARKPG